MQKDTETSRHKDYVPEFDAAPAPGNATSAVCGFIHRTRKEHGVAA